MVPLSKELNSRNSQMSMRKWLASDASLSKEDKTYYKAKAEVRQLSMCDIKDLSADSYDYLGHSKTPSSIYTSNNPNQRKNLFN